MNNDFFAVLPEQFTQIADSPARALMRTVLQQAVSDLADPRLLSHNSARSRERTRREAEAWFTSEDDSYLYSFVGSGIQVMLASKS
jgi:hypothetical protein